VHGPHPRGVALTVVKFRGAPRGEISQRSRRQGLAKVVADRRQVTGGIDRETGPPRPVALLAQEQAAGSHRPF
jgi:hypothetical protein